MWVWTAVFAFGVIALYQWSTTTVLLLFGAVAIVATILTLGPLRGRAATPPLEHTS
jgi:UDP-GlcNAc:undecaprenyl-phosphate GlcNAc-1-phosphate transferase